MMIALHYVGAIVAGLAVLSVLAIGVEVFSAIDRVLSAAGCVPAAHSSGAY